MLRCWEETSTGEIVASLISILSRLPSDGSNLFRKQIEHLSTHVTAINLIDPLVRAIDASLGLVYWDDCGCCHELFMPANSFIKSLNCIMFTGSINIAGTIINPVSNFYLNLQRDKSIGPLRRLAPFLAKFK